MKRTTLLCKNCGFRGKPKKKVKGYFFLEVLLWICLILPGLLYSIYRLANKYPICPECGAENMIPLDSPIARKILARN